MKPTGYRRPRASSGWASGSMDRTLIVWGKPGPRNVPKRSNNRTKKEAKIKSISGMIRSAICILLIAIGLSAHAQQEVVTSKGKFPLDANDAPEKETIQALFDEMDYPI